MANVNNTKRITKNQAQEFYRDLCGTVYGNCNKTQQGIMSIGLIADHMNLSIEKAKEFCDAMVIYGITERSSGKIIVWFNLYINIISNKQNKNK